MDVLRHYRAGLVISAYYLCKFSSMQIMENNDAFQFANSFHASLLGPAWYPEDGAALKLHEIVFKPNEYTLMKEIEPNLGFNET